MEYYRTEEGLGAAGKAEDDELRLHSQRDPTADTRNVRSAIVLD